MKKRMTTAVTIATLLSSSILPSTVYAAETESTESTEDSTSTTESTTESSEESTSTTSTTNIKEETSTSTTETSPSTEASKESTTTTTSKDKESTTTSSTTTPAKKPSSTTNKGTTSSSTTKKPSTTKKKTTSKKKTSTKKKSSTKSSTTKKKSTKTTSKKKTSAKKSTGTKKVSSSQKKYTKSTTKTVKAGSTPQTTNTAVDNALTVNAVLGTNSDVNESPLNITTNITGEKFVKLVGKYAAKIAHDNDLYASVMIAQACLESGFGSSSLSQAPYYNFFGIKGSYKGKSVTMQTLEDSVGGMYSINAGFRAYPSPEDSLKDYAKLLQQPLYKGARKSNTDSYKDATKYLTGRYATDRNYASKLNGIIKAYNLTKYDNTDGSDLTKVNKRIKVMKNLYYVVKIGDMLSQIAHNNDTSVEQIQKWNKNKITDINLIFPNQKLIVGKKVTYKTVQVDADDEDTDSTVDVKQGEFNMPLKPGSYTVTSQFGNRGSEHHDGIDLATPTNSAVYAAKDGVVMATGYDPSAGNYIFVYHGDGIYTNYFHLNKINVKIGDSVKAGHQIAKSGSTGNSTGPHLHFGISKRLWGDYLNPEHYLDF